MDLLDDSAVDRRLADVPEWRREGDEIRRTINAPDFPAAIRIVDEIAVEAEKLNHHPDIDIRWRNLHLALSTHDAGGLTELDFTLAARIDEIAAAHT
ncbi:MULTISPECIES: 4a-hydroxytetrahydrobiopterin dehydratase [Streptosporangium]|uniref:Putative pterin-4-alpha-carbinolamine dehydratase n=1 Tax=Streptosporangium brasiliense TaxID=47480 RepID=A0ABT9RAC7_9ACTN|nr:4a-hydroxytetrahydrobiopterin dehydratase [Streptosporangium brasiliense]MDP9865807.1 4a-hydroxytetrahydrobiopterin dehydratase [Streptosporangium brasiliense]